MVASEVDVLDDVLHIRIVVTDPGQDLERLVEKRRPGVAQAFAALVGARQALARRGHDHQSMGWAVIKASTCASVTKRKSCGRLVWSMMPWLCLAISRDMGSISISNACATWWWCLMASCDMPIPPQMYNTLMPFINSMDFMYSTFSFIFVAWISISSTSRSRGVTTGVGPFTTGPHDVRPIVSGAASLGGVRALSLCDGVFAVLEAAVDACVHECGAIRHLA